MDTKLYDSIIKLVILCTFMSANNKPDRTKTNNVLISLSILFDSMSVALSPKSTYSY